MSQALTWDLLVHPFYSLGSAGQSSYALGRVYRLRKNANFLMDVWKERVALLAAQQNAGLIVIRPDFEYWENSFQKHHNPVAVKALKEARKYFQSLQGFASRSLGPARFVVVHDNFFGSGLLTKKFGEALANKNLKFGNGTGLAMGEYLDSCVDAYSNIFTSFTGQGLRKSISRGVSADIGQPRQEFQDLVARDRFVKARARRIAKIRAARKPK